MDFPVGSTWAPGSKAFPWDGQGGVCFVFWMPKVGSIFPLELSLINLQKVEELSDA